MAERCERCSNSLPKDSDPRRRICDDCRRKNNTDWARQNRRPRRRLKKYNLTPDQYEEMFRRQNGVCMICKEPETAVDPKTKQTMLLAVDHDHQTGEVRGLLCKRCNMALDLIHDNPDRAFASMQYLSDPTERSNGGDWKTLDHVLSAIERTHERVDAAASRIDSVVSAQAQTNRKLTSLEVKFDKGLDSLREATNDALHKMEARIAVLEMPWKLLGNGWIKAGAAAGAATAIMGFLAKFDWIPFLVIAP